MEGRLLRLEGEVTALDPAGFTLDDGSGPARVELRRGAGSVGRAARQPRLGRRLVVVGVVGPAVASSGGWRLLARGPGDLREASAAPRGRGRLVAAGRVGPPPVARRRLAGSGPAGCCTLL
jgi:hypothetical protein